MYPLCIHFCTAKTFWLNPVHKYVEILQVFTTLVVNYGGMLANLVLNQSTCKMTRPPETAGYNERAPAVGDDDAVAGQRLSIVVASADHSATAAASAGDNDNDNNEANKPLPRAGTDANGGGRRRPDDRLASARRESASYDANAHGGRTTSSNDVTNEGGGAAGNAPGKVHRQQSAKKPQQ